MMIPMPIGISMTVSFLIVDCPKTLMPPSAFDDESSGQGFDRDMEEMDHEVNSQKNSFNDSQNIVDNGTMTATTKTFS